MLRKGAFGLGDWNCFAVIQKLSVSGPAVYFDSDRMLQAKF